MESRKRPHIDDGDAAVTKKRIIADAAGSPHVNGTRTDSEEPREGDSLEVRLTHAGRFSLCLLLFINQRHFGNKPFIEE